MKITKKDIREMILQELKEAQPDIFGTLPGPTPRLPPGGSVLPKSSGLTPGSSVGMPTDEMAETLFAKLKDMPQEERTVEMSRLAAALATYLSSQDENI